VTGIRLATTCDLLLAGYRGRPAEAVPLFSGDHGGLDGSRGGTRRPDGQLGRSGPPQRPRRYAEALAVAEPATEETYHP
jgi:hypothetical protein